MSKPNAHSKLSHDGFSDADRLMFDAGVSMEFRDMIKKNSKQMSSVIEQMKVESGIMQKAKDNIFELLVEMNKVETPMVTWMIENVQLGNFVKHWDKLELDQRFSVFTILDLNTHLSFGSSSSGDKDSLSDEIPLNTILELN